uniref:Uncharacterized protein n=1 Tax=Bombyx mori TaxID=7091 RepID=A0A8R2QX96_BOMMO|nr:uncharacterized protein LOC119628551 [Bombyx mori]
MRSSYTGLDERKSKDTKEKAVIPDENLPRKYLHSTYKFGWCPGDITYTKRFLHKTANITLKTWKDSQADYLYLLVNKHSQRFALQCIVMKAYVARKYLFRRSRLPLYYCQGQAYVLMMNTVQKIEMHEFYLNKKLNMPVTFLFEFYHPLIL